MDELVFESKAEKAPLCHVASNLRTHRICVHRTQGTWLRFGEPSKTLVELEQIERKAAKVTRGTVGVEGTGAANWSCREA